MTEISSKRKKYYVHLHSVCTNVFSSKRCLKQALQSRAVKVEQLYSKYLQTGSLICPNSLLLPAELTYCEQALKRSSVNSFLQGTFDKYGRNTCDDTYRKLSTAHEYICREANTEFIKSPFLERRDMIPSTPWVLAKSAVDLKESLTSYNEVNPRLWTL